MSKVSVPVGPLEQGKIRELDVSYEVLGDDGRWTETHSNSCDNPLGELWTQQKGRLVKIAPDRWRFKPRPIQEGLW